MAWAWRPTVGAGLPQTLGITQRSLSFTIGYEYLMRVQPQLSVLVAFVAAASCVAAQEMAAFEFDDMRLLNPWTSGPRPCAKGAGIAPQPDGTLQIPVGSPIVIGGTFTSPRSAKALRTFEFEVTPESGIHYLVTKAGRNSTSSVLLFQRRADGTLLRQETRIPGSRKCPE